jgi:Patatin-like phospholipase
MHLMRNNTMIAILFTLLLAGCGHFDITPPAVSAPGFCGFQKYQLTLDQTPKAFGDELMQAMEQNPGPVLYLSGGGQHGAFGAGFIDQWAENHDGKLPEFSVVTGVSTGALLSLAAFANDSKAAVDGYSISGEADVLRTFVKNKNGKLSVEDYLAVFHKGALADLSPFRREVRRIMVDDYDLIGKIAAGAAQNRKLYIAAVDVDTGYAVAFDMTDMAQRAVRAQDPQRRAFLADCMVEAVAASSSAPVAALPVFIDNRMYIDGGVRFGMFSDRIGKAIEDVQGKMREEYRQVMEPRDVYLIINGDQAVKPKCGKLDAALCTDHHPTGLLEGAHKDWNLLSMVARVVDLLSDQVYNFSEYKIEAESKAAGYHFQSVQIEKSVSAHPFTQEGQTRTCAQWRALDDARDHPIQFQARYMRCLIDFGKATARQKNW